MNNFYDQSYEKIKKALLGQISKDDTENIYAISFFIYDDDDEPLKPTLTLGYNTKKQVDNTKKDASDIEEARWNFAFWIQNNLAKIGDAKDFQKRDLWVKEIGKSGEDITEEFIILAQKISLKLHQDGVIKQVFGQSIPIIIHELEYYDEVAEQTLAANPEGVATKFSEWIFNM